MVAHDGGAPRRPRGGADRHRVALPGRARGEGAIIGIRGDTGIGKSRLARAAAHAAMQFDFRVVWGATRPQSAIPYGPLRELFSSILADPSGGIHGASEPTATWKTIREMGSRLDISETDRLHLGHLLHAGEAASALGHVEGRALQWNTMAAIRSWILAMSREAPQLVIFEDMHLSDPMTRQAIDFLAKGIGLSRSVVLLLYRRGYTPPAYAREMVLGGLTMDGMRDLVRGLLKSAELASELGPLLWERTLGNLLHAEEALRHLSECGVLSESPRLMASQIQQLPESLEMIVNAGLSRIHGRARHVLDVASVLGSTFSEDVLACVDAGAPESSPSSRRVRSSRARRRPLRTDSGARSCARSPTRASPRTPAASSTGEWRRVSRASPPSRRSSRERASVITSSARASPPGQRRATSTRRAARWLCTPTPMRRRFTNRTCGSRTPRHRPR
ncbi:MAG: AAA family ATPase [Acidobacteriota bacterium]